MSFRHDAIIDYMLLHPGKRMIDIAEHFGVSPAYLSTLRHSDNFSRELDARRARIAEKVEETTVARIRGLADSSLDIQRRRIESDPNIPIGEVRESCKMALEALGYSRSSSEGERRSMTNIQINISKEDLEIARSRIRSRSLRDGEEVEVETTSTIAAE